MTVDHNRADRSLYLICRRCRLLIGVGLEGRLGCWAGSDGVLEGRSLSDCSSSAQPPLLPPAAPVLKDVQHHAATRSLHAKHIMCAVSGRAIAIE